MIEPLNWQKIFFDNTDKLQKNHYFTYPCLCCLVSQKSLLAALHGTAVSCSEADVLRPATQSLRTTCRT
ncbi:MAG TPA: hypothetical protein VFF29_03540 [Bacteroidota bacterium]|nr:hypothetical protein [Bacteroidota bacterium]